MARPFKDGLEYFPLDTDFFENSKVRLIRSEFGAKGEYMLIYLMCQIYRNKGYYMCWNNDMCTLMSEGVKCVCSPTLTNEIVQGCVRRFFFDKGLFDAFGILTSPQIQRTYIKGCNARNRIYIYKEYFLLNPLNEKDIAKSTLDKLTLISKNDEKSGVNKQDNSQKKRDEIEITKEMKYENRENENQIYFCDDFDDLTEKNDFEKISIEEGIKKWKEYKNEQSNTDRKIDQGSGA